MRVIIIGTGLIGTSIALALHEHDAEVWLTDSDPAAARLAADLGAGDPLPETMESRADVAVIAVPPAAVAPALMEAQTAGLGDGQLLDAGHVGIRFGQSSRLRLGEGGRDGGRGYGDHGYIGEVV